MNDDILTATDGRPYERLRLAVAARLLSGALHDAPPAAASHRDVQPYCYIATPAAHKSLDEIAGCTWQKARAWPTYHRLLPIPK